MDKYIELQFKVKNINFRDIQSRFTICKTKVLSYKSDKNISSEITVKGTFPSIYKDDEFQLDGLLKFDETFGWYVEAVSIPQVIIPQNIKALAQFISKRVKGLSLKKSLEIVEVLGLTTLSQIKKDKNVLYKVNGLSDKKINSIYTQLIEHEDFEQLSMYIQSMNIEGNIACKIYEKFKGDSLIKLKSNPYCICYDNEIPFSYADKIAFNLGIPYNNKFRINTAIINYLHYRANNKGDICIYKDVLFNELNDYLKKVGFYKDNLLPPEEIRAGISNLTELGSITIETDKNYVECIYLSFFNYIENNIVKNLKRIMTEWKTPFCVDKQIDDFLDDYEKKYFPLDIKQKEAVYMALKNGLSILTGGPGVGKTQTTNTIVKCILAIKPKARIELLAPTGKASTRMKELINMKASTIHRELKINPYRKSNDLDEIDCDFVIIDESSMIDANIFNKLISSISDNTRVIFVGDVDQLPSVGAGLILRDMIDSGVIPVTRLTKIFRQGQNSIIVQNSHKIIKGITTSSPNGLDVSNKKGSNFIFWDEQNALKVKEKMLLSIDRLIDKYNMKFNDICILTPMRKGELGSIELNRLLQKKLNPPAYNKAEYEIDSLNCFRVGDKVIHTKNNYDLAVFNGDVGIITKIYTDISSTGAIETMMDVSYPQHENDISYSEKDFEELELCYCMTIHKSQGSEFPAVIMPIHRLQKEMLNRNLLYTGVTRAKEIFIGIGELDILDEAVNKIDITIRTSLLKEKLIEALSD